MISDGLRKTYRVPQLVLLTFEGPPPKELKDPTVNHIDGEKLNNYYKNLEWIERGVNSSIRFNKGAGELNHEAKLKEKDVENICDLLLNTNMTFEEIAKIFDVKKSVISEIKRQKKWTYITLKYPQLKHCRKVVHEENTGRFYAINPLLNGDKT